MIGGGLLADWVQRQWSRGRLMLCAFALLLAALCSWLSLQAEGVALFAWIFGIGWLCAYLYPVCIYPAIQDLVVPHLRATAMAVYFAGMYLLGAAFGALAVGLLSDYYAEIARVTEGVSALTENHRAAGLHDALILVPIALLVASVSCLIATRSYLADVARVKSN
jgi:MFS family permease